MILTYEQADRFYTLINALLGYANERFEVVRELPLPIVDLESQSKAALVAETLWDKILLFDGCNYRPLLFTNPLFRGLFHF